MQKIILDRDGEAPLKINADLIASTSGRMIRGKEQNRYHEIELYKTADGRYAVLIRYITQWNGELDQSHAFILTTPGDVTEKLSSWKPGAQVAGFPAGAQFEERQQKLLAIVQNGWNYQVRELLGQAGEEFAYEPLSSSEKRLIADVLNGCGAMIQHTKDYLKMMSSEGGSIRCCSGLQHEVEDGIELDQMHLKWEVDPESILPKIAAMGAGRRAALVQAIAGMWDRNDANFERDLDALEI
jgi:hypothetical protein